MPEKYTTEVVTNNTPDTTPNTTADDVSNTDSDSDKDYTDAGIFTSVLSSKAPYYEDGKERYVSDNSEFSGYKYTHYTILDMDEDGIEECLLHALQIVLVLHRAENEIYGYTYGFRAMDTIYKNGTFGWHGFSEVDGSQCYGCARIRTFTASGTNETNIWRVDNDGSESGRFYIGEDNKQVAKAEFDTYKAQYDTDVVGWISM